ncbi:MAG: hypothetical protein ACXACD_05910 [Candidatus Thorarchaeota archaeon]
MQSMYTFPLGLVAMGLGLLIIYLCCSSCTGSKSKDSSEPEETVKPYTPSRKGTWWDEEERPGPRPRAAEPSKAPSVAATTSAPTVGDFRAERMDPVLFEKLLDDMTSSAFTFEVQGWTTMELKERIDKVLRESGFTIVRSLVEDSTAERIEVKIGGWTRQVSTDKGLGVRITLKGVPNRDKAFCHMTVSAEDRSLVLPTINDLRKKIIS